MEESLTVRYLEVRGERMPVLYNVSQAYEAAAAIAKEVYKRMCASNTPPR